MQGSRRSLDAMADVRSHVSNTLARWALCMDDELFEELGECFTLDATVEFDNADRTIRGREPIVAEYRRRRARYGDDRPRHVITNVFVRSVEATRAEVYALVLAFAAHGNDAGRVIRPISVFHDRFVLEERVWRIRERSVSY